jgi:hypothetical protein
LERLIGVVEWLLIVVVFPFRFFDLFDSGDILVHLTVVILLCVAIP